MSSETGTFRRALDDPNCSYIGALQVLLASESRSTRGYTMARAALGAPTADNGSFVRMSDAMYELLEADGAGELKPPLSELLRENMGAYIDHWVGPAADRDMVPHAGIGALLLAQAITHGS